MDNAPILPLAFKRTRDIFVRFRSPYATGISLILLAITGCSNIPQAPEQGTEIQTTASVQTPVRGTPVLEAVLSPLLHLHCGAPEL